ncbi:MAG: ABC transporter permease [Lachnospiraceae bacterium]|nr:ABC transporter permease [Lachnospiraceae bacterium]
MAGGFFIKLAASNIKKNKRTYIPYLLTCMVTVAIYYIIKSLSLNPGLEKMLGADHMSYLMLLGSYVAGAFAFVFLFYTNSFLVKRRKKEFGVFNILGMEKKHLIRVLGWENVYVTGISLGFGLLIGILLDKVMFLIIIKAIGVGIPLGFFISAKAIGATVLLFAAIFLLIFLYSVRQVHVANPIDLLRAGNVGEKEPKTKWGLTVLGTVCLAAGYYIAFTVKNPLASILLFFVAAMLVIAGTYLLFIAGSIAVLKTLRKNKKYYYKTNHFSSVSGMIYRMKQNAAGLANICILSTMVLVMVSSTTALMIGLNDVIHTRYPVDFAVYSGETEDRSDKLFENVRELGRQKDIQISNEIEYTYLDFSAVHDDGTFHVGKHEDISVVNNVNVLFFVALPDYNRVMGEENVLKDREIMIYSNRDSFEAPVLELFGRKYKVAQKLDRFLGNGMVSSNIASAQWIVLPDQKEMEWIYKKQKKVLGDYAGNIQQFYGFDSDGTDKKQNAFYDEIINMLQNREYECRVESRAEAKNSMMGLYGGFFFIGVFLGALFIMATVLIIYYKQISEGYDDKERFAIMQKVGMSHEEVKASIHSQVLMVFFLPLVVAGIHVAAAYPIVSKLLLMLNLLNTKLHIACIAGCYLVFAVMYMLIYALTAKTYYRIVSKG